MYRCLFLIIAVFALNGCVIGEESAYKTRWVVPEGNRAFDTKVMQALNYEKAGESKQARDAFLQIYKDYQSEQALENAFMLTLFNNLDKGDELNELAKSHLDKNAALARFSAVYHLQNGELQAAQSVLERLVKWDKDFRNYELLGDVAAGKRNFKQALAHYKQSKAHLSEDTKPNEVITLKIAESELLLGQSKNAQKELESFVDELDCTARVCLLLAKIYNDKGENAKLEATYLRLYELTRDESFVRVLLERMMFEEKYINILAYNLETILAEKLETILSRGKANTRPRYYYDVYILYSIYKNDINFNTLLNAIHSTCLKRGSLKIFEIYKTRINEIQEDAGMNKLWHSYESNFEYAKGIKFKDICNIVRNIFEEIESLK